MIVPILMTGCCCTAGECDCATTAIAIDWEGTIELDCICDPECGAFAYDGSLSITSFSVVCTQRLNCIFRGSVSYTATATSCVEESGEPDREVRVDIVVDVYKLPPGAGGEWRVVLTCSRFVDGVALPWGGFGGDPQWFAEWLYEPDCTPPDGNCPCEGDYLLLPGEGFNWSGVSGELGNPYGCGGYMRVASLDPGSVTLS